MPFELRPGTMAKLQGFGRQVPSSVLPAAVSDAAPELFEECSSGHVVAINQHGGSKGTGSPAPFG